MGAGNGHAPAQCAVKRVVEPAEEEVNGLAQVQQLAQLVLLPHLKGAYPGRRGGARQRRERA